MPIASSEKLLLRFPGPGTTLFTTLRCAILMLDFFFSVSASLVCIKAGYWRSLVSLSSARIANSKRYGERWSGEDTNNRQTSALSLGYTVRRPVSFAWSRSGPDGRHASSGVARKASPASYSESGCEPEQMSRLISHQSAAGPYLECFLAADNPEPDSSIRNRLLAPSETVDEALKCWAEPGAEESDDRIMSGRTSICRYSLSFLKSLQSVLICHA
jgi:hypothetical protein